MPERKPMVGCKDGVYTAPERGPTDIAGRFNDLINSYICNFQQYIGLAILAILLVVIMLLAAYTFIKD